MLEEYILDGSGPMAPEADDDDDDDVDVKDAEEEEADDPDGSEKVPNESVLTLAYHKGLSPSLFISCPIFVVFAVLLHGRLTAGRFCLCSQ